MKTQDIPYIFDFDKTLISVEALEVLAKMCLRRRPQKVKILAQISTITEQGMNGDISFEESLSKRFFLIHPEEHDVHETVQILKESITPSIRRNKSFFKKNKKQIYVVSGGFRELILPITDILGIDRGHVFANTFLKDDKGEIIGFDRDNPLSKAQGKVAIVRRLNLKNTVAIGDGYTDLELKTSGAVETFVAFTEHITREKVVASADFNAEDFDAFLRSMQ